MKRPTQLITKTVQRRVLGAFSRATRSLRLSHKFSARIAGVTARALYTWRSGERRMLKRNARRLRLATLCMLQLSQHERDKFRKSADLVVAPREWTHVIALRRQIERLIDDFDNAKG